MNTLKMTGVDRLEWNWANNMKVNFDEEMATNGMKVNRWILWKQVDEFGTWNWPQLYPQACYGITTTIKTALDKDV
jgi:hypothetical protein